MTQRPVSQIAWREWRQHVDHCPACRWHEENRIGHRCHIGDRLFRRCRNAATPREAAT